MTTNTTPPHGAGDGGNRTCETCRFWEGSPAIELSSGWRFKNCHRNAPRVMPYHPGGYTDQVDCETVWARTSHKDWCGEYQEPQS